MKLHAALLVLALVVGTSAELAFTNSLHSKRSTEQAKRASGPAGYGYEKADVKHLCLKENKQYNCRYVGCPSVSECAVDASGDAECTGCYDCQTHAIGQSDLVCCDKPKSYGGYEEEGREDSDMSLTPSLKVGSCDWDMDIYRCEAPADTNGGSRRALEPNQGGCTESILMENGAYKIGTAWATCYLNADAEYCGHPFCDRMVMSFQGGVYVMDAYATNSGDLTGNGVMVEDDNEDGCFPFNGWIDGQGGNKPPTGNRTAGARSGAKHGKQSKMSALSRSIASTGLPKKLAAKYPDIAKHAAARKGARIMSDAATTATPAKPQYIVDSGYGPKYWEGIAVMFSGAVTVTSMDKQIDYTRGMMEYVPWFVGSEVAEGTKPAATAMLVTPNQYDILLVNDAKASSEVPDYPKEYAKGPEPKGPEHKPEGYYKKDDGPEHKPDYYKRDGGERDYYPPHPKGGDRDRKEHRGPPRDEEHRRGPPHRQ